MPGTRFNTFSASYKPEVTRGGKSICVLSPLTTILELLPKRVKNIFICSAVVFCASSKITNAFSSVRPRIYASGATSIVPRSINR